MRHVFLGIGLMVAALLVATGTNVAADKKEEAKKEVTLKGKITCSKCDLGTAAQCDTVIVVNDAKSKKDVIYYFDAKSHGKYHDDICTGAKKGTVVGVVTEANKKRVIAVKKVTYE